MVSERFGCGESVRLLNLAEFESIKLNYFGLFRLGLETGKRWTATDETENRTETLSRLLVIWAVKSQTFDYSVESAVEQGEPHRSEGTQKIVLDSGFQAENQTHT